MMMRGRLSIEMETQISIAISLKRIADALNSPNDHGEVGSAALAGARHPPNPAFPEGMDVDLSQGSAATCSTNLPYPAKRCGFYVVTCEMCGLRVVVTTAGRPDDPRSLKVACKKSAAS